MRALIEASADVNKAGNHGWTPFCIAAQEGQEAVVRALIEAGADLNQSVDNGLTPLLVGARKRVTRR